MLVLTREPGQSVRVGDAVVVTVMEVRGGRVRIGIEAPREIWVMRGERTGEPSGLGAVALAIDHWFEADGGAGQVGAAHGAGETVG